MAQTTELFPATGENNAGIGATAWTNPGNVVSDNATDATCNAAGSSQYLVARNFPTTGSVVPTNATIDGISVDVEASEHSTGTEVLNLRLQDAAGALTGTGKTQTISGTTKAIRTSGGVADKWGSSLTAADVHDADFGLRAWFTTAHDVRIDYISMLINYTVPPHGIATESSTALALARTKIKAMGMATCPCSALALGIQKIVAIGTAVATDTALALGRVKVAAMGLAESVESALALGRKKILGAVPALETALALSLAVAHVVPAVAAAETDTALACLVENVGGGAIQIPTGTALETDAALSLARTKVRSTGVGAEADTALTLGRVKSKAVGVSLEADSAAALGYTKSRTYGTATETDAAFGPGRIKLHAITPSTETDAAIAPTLGPEVIVSGYVSRTALSGKVSGARFVGDLARAVLAGTVSRVIYQPPWSREMFVNAIDYATIQAAIDALPADGGVVFIPRGTYNSSSIPSFTGITIPANVTVLGEGMMTTILDMAGQSASLNAVTITGSFSRIVDCWIKGQAGVGTGYGVQFGPGGDPLQHIWVERCTITNTPSWGVYVLGEIGNTTVISGVLHSRIFDVYSNGAFYAGLSCHAIKLDHVNMPCGTVASPIVKLEGVNVARLSSCTIEPATDSVGLEWATGGAYLMQLVVEDCYFEMHHAAASKYMVELTGSAGQLVGATFRGNKFVRYPEGTDKAPKVLRATTSATPCRTILLEGNTVYEKRTGAAYTDDCSLEAAAHELVMIGNTVWDATNGLTRPLSVTGQTAAVQRSLDYKRTQIGRIAAASEPTDAQPGELYYDTTNNRFRAYDGISWKTVTLS